MIPRRAGVPSAAWCQQSLSPSTTHTTQVLQRAFPRVRSATGLPPLHELLRRPPFTPFSPPSLALRRRGMGVTSQGRDGAGRCKCLGIPIHHLNSYLLSMHSSLNCGASYLDVAITVSSLITDLNSTPLSCFNMLMSSVLSKGCLRSYMGYVPRTIARLSRNNLVIFPIIHLF